MSSSRALSSEQRREKRRQKRQKDSSNNGQQQDNKNAVSSSQEETDNHVAELLAKNEDDLILFVAKVNRLFQDILKRPAPFMTFVFCGMQSAGKSTIMERFMNAPLNIVQEGTGTRCPLDTTCIHDESLVEPRCDLHGEELLEADQGNDLTVNQVFERITAHNKKLGNEDRFSTQPLRLVYKAKNVQNMRFVDTPGIISNKSTGNDNREDIKAILLSEMNKPNSKLCVLLEPKEFATNHVIEVCDCSLGPRDDWMKNATFLMTKFDKQMEDSRSGSKANTFFREFLNNKCVPHLVITPTLPKEDLPSKELFEARRELLASADTAEKDRFRGWLDGHVQFRDANGGDDEVLDSRIGTKIGFPEAKKKMRQIMLEDTIKRLPEVLAFLRKEQERCMAELQGLKEKQKFTDPNELKVLVPGMLYNIQERILAYLDGDLASALNFPEKLQTLEQEIDDEENSDWTTKQLNFHSEKEDDWRERIAELEEYPPYIQDTERFLGGKQYQRALKFFHAVMIEALPDPYELKDKVANATGYLSGSLERENWEHAMVQITSVLMKDVTHPGVN